MRKISLIVLALAFALVAAACSSDSEETTTTAAETTTEAPAPDLGTAENPIKVLFVPSVDAQVITSGGEIMADALNEATGLEFEVAVPTSYAATAEEMCAAPEKTMAFIPGLLYVLATDLCGVDVSFKAVRYGHDVYWTQYLVPRDSDVSSIEDLEGLTWAYPDAGSTSGFMVPTVMLDEAGITTGETVEAGSHNAAALAVYNGDADVGTTFYSPWLNYADDGDQWDGTAETAEIPDDLVDSCAVTPEDKLFCGDLRVLDARASVRTEAPDIVQKVKIAFISPPIPNDTLSFGSEFPADIRAAIEDALVAFAAECDTDENCAWNESIGSQDFYNWTGIQSAADDEYDFIRQMVALTGYTP
ncbi:MAG: phosphate/phosphite/phosphonate ABC transporter substrate-binding protein [Actinomycetota bacterium]|nr:phosphate/phosphite/phosphonate ABC transporter substrate-binding protein [Actinomycetota bacterium]